MSSDKTFFETISRGYERVTIDEKGINTIEFLEATEGLIKMFDLLGSSAFSIVQNDMNGNVKKIRDRFLTNPQVNDTLQHLVEAEKGEKKRVATEGLLWLKRGLDFTAQALRRSYDNPSEELSVSFTKAYEGSLRAHHGMLVRPVFTLAMKACPYRKDFFSKLGPDNEQTRTQMVTWLSGLEKCVQILNTFYSQGGHDKF
ncbi:uncharacterized protein VTP21DRAFT_11513 [Calcarisporiella thermophila]|uniref:uncharacterized protein n=1 Tax=Calcarisporiella thermophila TaxID=911321 RepID=UPI0037438104